MSEETNTTVTAESILESLARQIAHQNHGEVKDLQITAIKEDETA